MNKISLVLLVIIGVAFWGLVNASPTATLHLGYDNGSYSTVTTGSYSSLYRISNVWYVNGVELSGIETPASSEDLDFTLVLGITGFLLALACLGLFLIKRRM
jgi:hypothetical protein